MIDKSPPASATVRSGNPGDSTTFYKIGDLAREFDVTLRTLRFYEDKGLITPQRAGTTRLYSTRNRDDLQLALFGKRIGLTLKEIAQVLKLNESPQENAGKLTSIFTQQLKKLREEQEQLVETIKILEQRLA